MWLRASQQSGDDGQRRTRPRCGGRHCRGRCCSSKHHGGQQRKEGVPGEGSARNWQRGGRRCGGGWRHDGGQRSRRQRSGWRRESQQRVGRHRGGAAAQRSTRRRVAAGQVVPRRMDGSSAGCVATDNSAASWQVTKRRAAAQRAAAHGTKRCLGKDGAGVNEAGDSSVTNAGTRDAGYPEHSNAGDIVSECVARERR